MAGRKPGWRKVHEKLDAVIEQLGEVRASGELLVRLAWMRLQLEDVQTLLEEIDVNWRSGRHVEEAA